MIHQMFRRWFGLSEPVLALQLVGSEARYVVRQGARILTQGTCYVPEAIEDGHVVAPALLAQFLLPQLLQVKGVVAILLPTRWLHVHEMNLPLGLSHEELAYQISRHITHNLGLSLDDVYYDWTVLDQLKDKRVTNIQLAIARQADVTPFYEVFVESNWRLKWVCSESQVWALAHQEPMFNETIAICQVEQREVTLWLIDADNRVRSFYKRFDDNQFARAGFVYHASQSVKDGSLQLPARFIADELASILPVWLGTNMQDLTMLYVTGNGVGWDANMSMIQAQLGLPLHKAEERLTSGIFGGSQQVCESGLAALWYLSKQVRT